MILVIDNFDSFTHNLARYIVELGCEVVVKRNNEITLDEIRALAPDAIVISPGPCTPNEAGISLEVIKQCHTHYPILGVCLGHQAIAQAFGANIIRAPQAMHGKVSTIRTTSGVLFHNLPKQFTVTRYHSLVIEPNRLPSGFVVTATTDDNVIMAIEAPTKRLFGVQFHPESLLTEHGHAVLNNFLLQI